MFEIGLSSSIFSLTDVVHLVDNCGVVSALLITTTPYDVAILADQQLIAKRWVLMALGRLAFFSKPDASSKFHFVVCVVLVRLINAGIVLA